MAFCCNWPSVLRWTFVAITPRYSNGTTPFSGSLKVDSKVTPELSCLILVSRLIGASVGLWLDLSRTQRPEKPSSFALITVTKAIVKQRDMAILCLKARPPQRLDDFRD